MAAVAVTVWRLRSGGAWLAAVQPRRQLGGGGDGCLAVVAAAQRQWRQHGGSGGSLAATMVEAAEALWCQLGVVVAAAAAACLHLDCITIDAHILRRWIVWSRNV